MPPPSALTKIAPLRDIRTDGKPDPYIAPSLRQADNKVISRTRTGFTEAYAQTVSADCEFDLRRSNMVLAQDVLSCLADHLCLIIFKSHHVG